MLVLAFLWTGVLIALAILSTFVMDKSHSS